eukprot:16979-Heterococcus_DN1.PRE.2
MHAMSLPQHCHSRCFSVKSKLHAYRKPLPQVQPLCHQVRASWLLQRAVSTAHAETSNVTAAAVTTIDLTVSVVIQWDPGWSSTSSYYTTYFCEALFTSTCEQQCE